MAGSPSFWQIDWTTRMDGKNYHNQVHYKQASTDEAPFTIVAVGQALIDAFHALWSANINPITSDATTLMGFALREFDETIMYPEIPPAPVGTPQRLIFREATVQEYPLETPEDGNVGSQPLPAFNAYRASKLTGLAGRRKRGHTSIVGVPESLSEGNTLLVGDWGTWSNNAAAFLNNTITVADDLFTYTMRSCVVSITQARADNIVGAFAGAWAYPITATVANRLIGTMRRRKKKTL